MKLKETLVAFVCAITMLHCGDATNQAKENLPAVEQDADPNITDTLPEDINVDEVIQTIKISGVLDMHTVSKALAAASGVQLSLGNPGDMLIQLVNPMKNWQVLAEGSVDACSAEGCQWSFDNVDISGLSLGLIALITDQRDEPQFELTAMGLMGQNTIKMLQDNPVDYQSPVPAWIVSSHSLALVSKLTQTDAELNRQNGYVFGMALSHGDKPAPIAGVQVDVLNPNIGDVYYPKADFSGLQEATSVTGFFFAAAQKEQMIVSPWNASLSDESFQWSQIFAGTQPGMAFVLLWKADQPQ